MCIDTNTWRMIHGNKANKSSEVVPPGRHSHTSVVFDQAMWVYGGMTDLTERSDLWKLDLGIFFVCAKKYVNSNLNHFLHIKKSYTAMELSEMQTSRTGTASWPLGRKGALSYACYRW